MGTTLTPQQCAVMDVCHQQMQTHLAELERMALHMAGAELDKKDRKLAAAIESFFSHSAREHHLEEDRLLFPALLASGGDAAKEAVRCLQQDHGFLDEDWIELGPQLRAIAEGNDWIDQSEFQHNVALYLALLRGHIALEDALIHPECSVPGVLAQTRHRKAG